MERPRSSRSIIPRSRMNTYLFDARWDYFTNFNFVKIFDWNLPYAIQLYCSKENKMNELLDLENINYWIRWWYKWGFQIMPFASILDIIEPAYLSFINKN